MKKLWNYFGTGNDSWSNEEFSIDLACVLLTIIMNFISNKVYSLWVGDDIHILFSLSVVYGVYFTISNWNDIFSYFINDVRKNQIQLHPSVVVCILFIPLAYYWGLHLRIVGIMLPLCICLIVSAI